MLAMVLNFTHGSIKLGEHLVKIDIVFFLHESIFFSLKNFYKDLTHTPLLYGYKTSSLFTAKKLAGTEVLGAEP